MEKDRTTTSFGVIFKFKSLLGSTPYFSVYLMSSTKQIFETVLGKIGVDCMERSKSGTMSFDLTKL